MTRSVRRYLDAAVRAVERHGGGWRGLWSVIRRAVKVAGALGVGGLVGRLRQAGARHVLPLMASRHAFPSPLPLAEVRLRIGVMAHLFYPDLIDEFATDLSDMPLPYSLLVSVMDVDAMASAQHRLAGLPNLRELIVRVVPNRGRDIAPLLVTFREEVLALDVVGHIHTKKSLYTGTEQGGWRRYLLKSLFGDKQRLAWIFGMFEAEPKLGLMYPESYEGVPLWAHTWLSNAEVGDQLAARLGFAIDRGAYIDFPAGSMFWARVDALRPLYDLNLRLEDFPEEHGQVDGTLQHAAERLFAAVVQHGRYLLGILPQDGTLQPYTEGERNWQAAFDTPLATRLQLSAVEARLVTVDIFDTLVTRPFVAAEGARDHLAFLARRRLGIEAFADLRARAESRARLAYGRDPTLDEIYAAALSIQPNLPSEKLKALELQHEQDMLRPRTVVAETLAGMRGKQIAALSDMYLPGAWLRGILPEQATVSLRAWWMSCETGQRKDEASTWHDIAQREGVPLPHWLHVGDNERSDIQMPQLQGMLTPVQVLRPGALLEVVPALRELRHPRRRAAPWPEQLWRGLVALRFSTLADRDPSRLSPAPCLDAESAGYVVLGPLILDYLAWLARMAIDARSDTVLFLSREGHLLAQAWQRLRDGVPALRELRGVYLLASRRATGLPTLRDAGDLAFLLRGTFTGTLRNLLKARLGDAATEAAAGLLGNALDRDIYLPEMREQLLASLHAVLPTLLPIAAEERELYLRYWDQQVGKGEPLIADIGYAGSIQLHLSQMTGRPLRGAYFALRDTAVQLVGHGSAEARHHDGRQSPDTDSALLRHDLLLEAMLTAPAGQFEGFRQVSGESTPQFAPSELSTQGQRVLAQVHSGALQFVDDVLAMAGEDFLDMDLDAAAVAIPLQCLAEGRWVADEWLSSLATEDAFTGRGRVTAGQ